MESAPIIRLIRPEDDLVELTEVLNRAYRHLAEQGMKYVATWQDADITRKRVARGECWVAELDERLVGSIVLEDANSTAGCPWYERPDVWSFHQFGVDSDIQGRGIGRLLLDKVEERARTYGAAELALDTAESAADLIRMYEGRGYRRVDTVDWPPTNYVSVVLSKRLIAAS